MKIRIGKKHLGMTLIELMIVVGIVAILLALAYPSYVDYVRKAKRGDAQQILLNWSINQEIFRSNNLTYAGTGNLAAPVDPDATYVYSLGEPDPPTAVAYTLQAAAQGDQAKDKSRTGVSGECATLTLDQNGVKTPLACWE